MNMIEIEKALKQLRLSGVRATLETRLIESQASNLSFLETFSALLQDEPDRRQSRLLERRYQLSGLEERASLAEFDWGYNPKIPKRTCFELHTLKFVAEGASAILIGPPGTGKSHVRKRSPIRHFSPALRWYAVALYVVIPVDFMIPHFLATEAVFTPLLLVALSELATYAAGDRRARHVVGAGLLLGAACLTRPILLGWLPFLGVGFIPIALRAGAWRGAAHAALTSSQPVAINAPYDPRTTLRTRWPDRQPVPVLIDCLLALARPILPTEPPRGHCTCRRISCHRRRENDPLQAVTVERPTLFDGQLNAYNALQEANSQLIQAERKVLKSGIDSEIGQSLQGLVHLALLETESLLRVIEKTQEDYTVKNQLDDILFDRLKLN